MSKTYELVRDFVAEKKFKVINDDGENIVINYQMNTIFIFKIDEENFVSMILPDFAEVNEENYSDVVMNCNRLNEKLQQVKLYTMDSFIVASSEFYYLGKEDLVFQMQMSLDNLVAAKVRYQKIAGL